MTGTGPLHAGGGREGAAGGRPFPAGLWLLRLSDTVHLLDPSLVPSARHCLFPGSIHKAHGQNYNCVSEHLDHPLLHHLH